MVRWTSGKRRGPAGLVSESVTICELDDVGRSVVLGRRGVSDRGSAVQTGELTAIVVSRMNA